LSYVFVVDADPDVAVPRDHTGNPKKDDVAIVVLALLDIDVYDAEVLVAFPYRDEVVEMEDEDEDEVIRGVTEEVLIVDDGKDDVKSMDEALRDVVEGVGVVVTEVVRENVELVLVLVDVLEAKLDELELIVTDKLRVEAELDDSGIVTVTVGGLTLTSITEYAVEITVAGDEVIVTKTV
jgi:hypothetical protein